MSNLSYMEKLLDEVDVEWKALGDVAEIKRGTSITKKNVTDGDIPVIAGGRTPAYYHNESNRDGQTIVIAGSGAYAGFVSWWEQPIFVSDAFTVKPINTLMARYCYHFLMNMQQQLHDFKSGGGVPHVYPRDVSPIKIPIPCPDNPEKSLAIQAEIVRILDAFTAMTAELTAELNMRKKQYNYYRDKLLSFEEGEVEWKTLGEVALDFGRGKSKHRPRNDPSLYGGDIPFIQTGDIRNAAHTIRDYSQTYSELGLKQSKLWPKGTLCITIAANIAETSILGFDACFPDSVIGFVANPEETSSSYVEYLLSSIKTQLEEKGQGSAQSNINLGTFQNLKLPFPPITEQERIVALLDKFELLTNSITEGLPREIELRQKQYEYYRDLLLSFPKSDEAA
ncbi:restriction endonuclease subunit S [Oceanobacter sp. 5_MG-2023]|uniref:restriction endonuclease subunit S n=1 Tax=Oceanobacter sp. 5_MG-2023 TaxID=3062645 RepID=UPI0026E39C84|nr:restriction endonuclease subunit S [Oceanobacter sp. 5_MG-2023]MDO6682927.1 restriction endonuclease subunit S [Oceanobacter sp. 5_MG-2023]